MDAILARLRRGGVAIALETQMNGEQVAFIRDPSGVLLELIQDR